MGTRRTRWIRLGIAALLFAMTVVTNAFAHTEYQVYVQQTSGRTVNCALCHTHSDGPDGTARGQIGSLSIDERARLDRARSAFNPGVGVDSPILNDFGDHILNVVGKKAVLEMRIAPAELASRLGDESDLDEDGIPDAREYLDGTHPLNPHHGDPWRLFRHNFSGNVFQLAMIAVATLVTLYGLSHLLRGFASMSVGSED